MPVIIKAAIDRRTGWASLHFPYDAATLPILKQFPGVAWRASEKHWACSLDVLPILQRHLKIEIIRDTPIPHPGLHENLVARLRDYQVQGAQWLVSRHAGILTYDMRVGKTPTTLVALAAMLGSGFADSAVILYPNSVSHEWVRQLGEWINLPIHCLSGTDDSPSEELRDFMRRPMPIVGCHYEILAERTDTLWAITEGRRFILIGDEIHMAKNSRSERSKTLLHLCKREGAVRRWFLTGTPMRNRPKDVAQLFEYVTPGSMQPWGRYRERYCGAFLAEFGTHQVFDQETKEWRAEAGHWDDSGRSNEDELGERLDTVSLRKTRAEVAAHLPRIQRAIIHCNFPVKLETKYRRLESAMSKNIHTALGDTDPGQKERDMIEQLVAITSEAKVPTAVGRAMDHCDERGTKVIIFAHFHATLRLIWDKVLERCEMRACDEELRLLTEPDTGRPIEDELIIPGKFLAGGWLTPERRKEGIAAWKAHKGPAILVANTMSTSVGIDLSDAERSIFAEPEWVPADYMQAEARIVEVHLGKRTTPPMIDLLMVKGTIDEAMATALVKKITTIESIVGQDAESRNLSTLLRDTGSADTSRLGLIATDAETVKAAILSIRDRWLATGTPGEKDAFGDRAAIAGSFEENWDDEESSEEEGAEA